MAEFIKETGAQQVDTILEKNFGQKIAESDDDASGCRRETKGNEADETAHSARAASAPPSGADDTALDLTRAKSEGSMPGVAVEDPHGLGRWLGAGNGGWPGQVRFPLRPIHP